MHLYVFIRRYALFKLKYIVVKSYKIEYKVIVMVIFSLILLIYFNYYNGRVGDGTNETGVT